MLNLYQNTKDNIQKKVNPILNILTSKENKNQIRGIIKINDRLTITRLTQALGCTSLTAKIEQKTTVTVKHEKEKKITTKTKEISILFPTLENEKEINLYFSYLRNAIKYKIYKKYSLICYISMPSIKINFAFHDKETFTHKPNILQTIVTK